MAVPSLGISRSSITPTKNVRATSPNGQHPPRHATGEARGEKVPLCRDWALRRTCATSLERLESRRLRRGVAFVRDEPLDIGGDVTMARKCLSDEDTPIIPGTCFRVHDGTRPQPRIVHPGTASTQEHPGEPPSDAVILFDGAALSRWVSVTGGEASWRVEQGYMEVIPGAGDIQTRDHIGDCQLHLEWAAPAKVHGEGQRRGNSGVWLMGRYEIQILDGYENPTYADGTTAAIYGQYPPLVNACRKPGEWQCYDMVWIAPRFNGNHLLRPAYLTALHNGLVVHHHTSLFGPTQHRQVASYQPHAPTAPLRLQDHGDAVRYRNIWYRPLKGYDEP